MRQIIPPAAIIYRYLQTAVSVSMARNFPNVNFIDSPGLVDGNVSYHFDVNNVRHLCNTFKGR